MRTARRRAAAVLAGLLAVATAVPVLAQTPDPTPTPAPPAGPSAGDIGGAVASALLSGLPDLLYALGLRFFREGLPGLLGDAVQWALRALWDGVAWLFAPINVFTQLPDLWTYNLPAVRVARDQLAPPAAAIVAAATVATVLLAGLGTIIGRPFGWVLNRAPYLLLAGAGIAAWPLVSRWWVDFANALSGALLDPLTGLPGLDQMTAVGQALNLGWVALLYAVFALFFLVQRITLLVYACLCLAIGPLAIAAGVLPVPLAQRFFGWWLTTFLGVCFVQVLQALCLGIGANILLVGGASSDGRQGVMAGLIGAGAILAAGTVPGLLLRRLTPAAASAPGWLWTVLNAATVLAGVGLGAQALKTWAWPVLRTALPAGAPATATVSTAAAASRTGYVRSLLGGAPLALPPPKP
jgi:hypothetical protein